MHQPNQAKRSLSPGVGVSSAPERCAASAARTLAPQYHCTTPMWWARSRTDHSGQEGTRASRSADSDDVAQPPAVLRDGVDGVVEPEAHGALISSSPPT